MNGEMHGVMNRPSQRRWLRRTEGALLLTGLLCTAICVNIAIHAAFARRASEHLPVASDLQGSGVPSAAESRPRADVATVMGRLEIPALGLSVPILSSYETTSLLQGIGHIPGTAMPGGLGTLGLAGHRDTYFRPLAKIRPKMDIRVIDGDGTYHYAVDSTEIVKPEDVAVLNIQHRPELTLITCYPFYYVGAAPLRFIVHAHLLSALPDPAG
jgi:sortase A